MNSKHHRLIGILLLLLGLTALHTALAQEIQVNSADPATAIQGTLALDVEIGGKGFDNTIDVVEFLLPCSVEPCTDTGGITVKKFKVRGQKKIIVTIDISNDAVVAGMDSRAPIRIIDDDRQASDKPAYRDFMQRFESSYRDELSAFLSVVRGERDSPCTGADAKEALRIATAATLSLHEKRPVAMEEIN